MCNICDLCSMVWGRAEQWCVSKLTHINTQSQMCGLLVCVCGFFHMSLIIIVPCIKYCVNNRLFFIVNATFLWSFFSSLLLCLHKCCRMYVCMDVWQACIQMLFFIYLFILLLDYVWVAMCKYEFSYIFNNKRVVYSYVVCIFINIL